MNGSDEILLLSACIWNTIKNGIGSKCIWSLIPNYDYNCENILFFTNFFSSIIFVNFRKCFDACIFKMHLNITIHRGWNGKTQSWEISVIFLKRVKYTAIFP